MFICGTSVRSLPASGASNMQALREDIERIVRERLAAIHTMAPGSIGDQMEYELVSCDPASGVFTMRCRTAPWMRNIPGTLHGGICATVMDQAMGFIAYCVKPGDGIAPTVELNVHYHRALIPGEDVLVRVEVMSVTKSLMHLSSQAWQASAPDRLCLSASALNFYKPL